MYETIITALIVIVVGMAFLLGYMFYMIKQVGFELNNQPTIDNIIKKVLETRVPIVFDQNGQPLMSPAQQKPIRQEKPSMYG